MSEPQASPAPTDGRPPAPPTLDASEERSSGADRPRWAAFTVTIVVMLLLVAVPASLGALLPPQAAGVVGVYERVTLSDRTADDRAVVGGFIAPQGWLQLDPSDEGSEGDRAGLGFTTDDGAAAVTASLHLGVESSESLLRAGAPLGASFAEIREADSSPLVQATMLEYDLDAGGGINQRVAVCDVVQASNCLLFVVEIGASLAGADADSLQAEIAAMVRSAEVTP